MKRLSLIDLCVAMALAALGMYLFVGFLHPDPWVLEKGPVIHAALWALRIAVGIGTLAVVLLYLAIRTRRVSGAVVLLLIFGAAIAFAFGYPVAQYFYEKSYVKQIEKYHPYLQIRPNPLPDLPNRDSTFLILCLGGSTTEFADEAGKGWPGRLQKLLPATISGRSVAVLNMGRQWYTTQHTLLNYELNLRHVKPDLIIVMQAVNDVLVNADFSFLSHDSFRGDYGHFYGAVNRLIDRENLFGFARETISGLWYFTPREVVDTDVFPGLVSFERNINTLIDLATIDGTRVVLMTEPHLYKEQNSQEEQKVLHLTNYETIGRNKRWSIATARRGMEAYNRKVEEIAEKRHVGFIDLDQAVPRTLEYFYDEVHYRTGAYDLVAAAVAEGVLKSGVLPIAPVLDETSRPRG